jgi:pyruvate kinase
MGVEESLASSAVRTAQKVQASIIVCLSRTGTTSRLIAKYRPDAPILSVCYAEEADPASVARRSLVSRGIIPVIQPPEWGQGNAIVPQEVMRNAILYARDTLKIVKPGDAVVGVHRLLGEAILKVVVCPEGNAF